MTRTALLALTLTLVACGNNTGADDSDDDPCFVSDTGDAIDTVGCNGFQSGAVTENADFGDCTRPGDEDTQGSCDSSSSMCFRSFSETDGLCAPRCDAGSGQVATSTCPTGSRCFVSSDGSADVDLCFRDCDAAHPCPGDQECRDGSCL